MLFLITFVSCKEEVKEKENKQINKTPKIEKVEKKQKIGFVDRTKALNAYKAKIAVEDKYKPLNDQFLKRRDNLIAKFNREYNEAAVKARTLNPAEQQKLGQQFKQRETALGNQLKKEQEALEKKFEDEVDGVINAFKAYIKKYAEEQGYDLILGTSESTNTVLYAKDEDDLTEEIIKGINNEYAVKNPETKGEN